MNAISSQSGIFSVGLMSAGLMTISQGLLSSEFFNTGSSGRPPATTFTPSFIDFDPSQQVIVVDDDEKSWLKLLAHSRKKLAAEED
jgi:hypothetical protein